MSIQTEINRIAQAKDELRDALIAKGATLTAGALLDEFADAVSAINTGGAEATYGVIDANGKFQALDLGVVPPVDEGAAEVVNPVMYVTGRKDPEPIGKGKYRVRFFDYDGTILKTVYTDGGAVTAPNVPEHERLLFLEWNNDFDDITSDLDVGAIYTTKSGKCEFDIWINAQTGSYGNHADKVAYFNPYLVSGTLTIEWGDGIVETLTTAGGTNLTHTYPAYGKYTILVSISDGGAWKPNKPLFAVNGGTGDANSDYSVMEMRLTGFGTSIDIDGPFRDICCCQTVSLARDVAFGNKMSAFERCMALKHVNLPRTQPLRYSMFVNCHSLRSFTFQTGTAGDLRHTFTNCYALRELLLSGCTAVSGMQFAVRCCSATRIDLHAADSINHEMMQECYSLSHITIPETVTYIGLSFGRCYSLRTIVMKSTTPPEIGTNAFSYNGDTFYGSLKEIIVPAGCGEAYKSATNWSAFADIIKEEEI